MNKILIYLFVFLLSLSVKAQVNDYFPENNILHQCYLGALSRYNSLLQQVGIPNGSYTEGVDVKTGFKTYQSPCPASDQYQCQYVEIQYVFINPARPENYEFERCSDFITLDNAGIHSSLIPLFKNNTFKPQIACGSVIDYDKKIVIETIPITGTNFNINYSSDYNSKSKVNKILEAQFSNNGDNLRVNSVVVAEAGVPVYEKTTLSFLNIKNIKYIWDGEANPTLSNNFVNKETFFISAGKKFNFQVNGYCEFYSFTPLQFSCPFLHQDETVRTNLIPLFNQAKRLTSYKPEVFGLSGWTLSDHHYFDREDRVLFSGTGQRIQYISFKTINDSVYGAVDLVIEKNSGEEIYIFDQQGRHLETRHALMKYSKFKFNYDSNNKITSIVDQFGKSTSFVYDQNKLQKIVAPYGQETQITVNNLNQITNVKDPLLNDYVMEYDTINQLTKFTSVSGVETIFAYNQDGELTSETKNIGIVQTFTENLSSWIKEQTHSMSFGVVKKVTTQLSSNGAITSEYDSENRKVVSIYNNQYGLGAYQYVNYDNVTSYEQFSLDPVWQEDYAPTSRNDLTINESNQTITQTTNITETRTYQDTQNPLTINTGRTVASLNNKSSTVLVDANQKSITYTNSENLNSIAYFNEQGLFYKIEQPSQSPTFFTYNANGQLIKTQKGNQFEDYTYDNAGNIASVTNSKNQTTSFIYDANSRLTEKTLPNSDKIKLEYSNNGDIKKITAPNNQVYNFQLSLGDYLQNIIAPNNTQTSFEYDADKRLTKITKPSGKEIVYTYKNQSANLQSITTPEGTLTITEIDSRSRLKSITSADNIKTEIAWVDTQIQKQTWYDSDNSLIASISFNYFSNEMQLRNIELNNNQIADYRYHPNGKISAVIPAGVFANYNYAYTTSSSSNTIQMNSLFINYTTADSQDGNQPTLTITATAKEDVTKQIFITLNRSFDNFGQASNYSTLTMNNNLGVLNSYYQLTPQYDANDRLTQIQKVRRNYLNGQEVSNTDFYNHYSYPLGSNNNMKEFKQTTTENGNPQKRTIATHDNEDRLTSLRGSIHRDYTYTDDGDLKTMTNCYGTTTYDYDVFGNLKKVTLTDGKVIEYKVDAQNRRIKKLINGVTKEYYLWYDQIHLAAILDENKVPKLTYIYGPESQTPSYVIKDNITYRILHDPGLGSIRYIVNPTTQQIMQDIEYDEYGNVMKNTNPEFQPLTYAGGLYDSDTKLIRFGARDYDPTIGRWTAKDPIGFAGGDTNLYAYVGGNPMSYTDRKGTDTDGVGLSLSLSFIGFNGTGDIQYVTDDKGRKGIAVTVCGGGITQAVGATLSAVFASTNAKNIAHLAGGGGTAGFAVSSNTGLSFNSGMSFSQSEAGEKQCSYKVTGQQVNLGGGIGLGSPLEFSAGACKTFVYPL